jgi:hypothetical protein
MGKCFSAKLPKSCKKVLQGLWHVRAKKLKLPRNRPSAPNRKLNAVEKKRVKLKSGRNALPMLREIFRQKSKISLRSSKNLRPKKTFCVPSSQKRYF